eukprot:8763672-Alexandrium_andersonii.AAC.1
MPACRLTLLGGGVARVQGALAELRERHWSCCEGLQRLMATRQRERKPTRRSERAQRVRSPSKRGLAFGWR